MGEFIEEDLAFLEAIKVHDEDLIREGVTDPDERFQIIYLALILGMVDDSNPASA